ncbi:hypothetical protein BJX96DRAFT_163676 [Aspergillus floccosus]
MVDNKLCCVACGAKRRDWHERPDRIFEVSSVELEQTRVSRLTPTVLANCTDPKRLVSDEPRTGHQSISGICAGDQIGEESSTAFRYISSDPQEPAFSERGMGGRIGYPVHAHCWLLMDRVIGHDVVKANLRAFIEALHNFWRTRPDIWGIELGHEPDERSCYEGDQYWLKRHRARELPPSNDRTRVTQASYSNTVYQLQRRCPAIGANLPMEVVEYMIDMIILSQPRYIGVFDDIRNMLKAFEWKLPETTFKARCPTDSLYELDDLVEKGVRIDWEEAWYQVERLLFRHQWYCESGLKNRGRNLKVLYGLKKCFLDTLEGEIINEQTTTEEFG